MVLLSLILTIAISNVNQSDRINIVVTTGMVADITRQVVGEYGEVTALMGEGVDPHLYKPTAADARAIIGAEMIFYSGLLLEGRMSNTFVRVAEMGKAVYPVTELIDKAYLLDPPEFKGHSDPHVWMDVSAWGKAVEAVALALCEFDPEHCETFQTNATLYIVQLVALHKYALKAINSIPQEQRVLITAHDAFNYFGRAYGIEVIGIQGLSTESEAGIEDINRLVDLIVARGVQAVFVESSVSDRHVLALIEGAASRGHSVKIGGRLFSDAMGKRNTYKGTYIGMLDHNITTITSALGGVVPVGGFAETQLLEPTLKKEGD